MRKSLLMRLSSLSLVVVLLVGTGLAGGCYTQSYDVGTGADSGESQEFRQWFALWGLVPITEVEGSVESYAAGDENYTVTTGFTPIDVLIGIFTNVVTIGPKTVTVEK